MNRTWNFNRFKSNYVSEYAGLFSKKNRKEFDAIYAQDYPDDMDDGYVSGWDRAIDIFNGWDYLNVELQI